MTIIDFDFDPELLQRFLDFPHQHYASDSNGLPDPSEARLLAPRAALHAASAPTWRNFLAVDSDNHLQGRLTAIVNPAIADEQGQPFGQIGFFECVNDPQIATALIETGLGWLRTHSPQVRTVLGPMNFDTWHAYRLRVSGFDEPTFEMEPYNPAYYPALWENVGFAPSVTYVTTTITDSTPLLTAWESHHAHAIALGFTFRPLNPNALSEELAMIYRLAISIFQDNLFFTPISQSEFLSLYAGKGAALDPELLIIIQDPHGEPVGLSFTFPDPRSPTTAHMKSGGLLPTARHAGVGAAAMYEVHKILIRKGFTVINHCLMREGIRMEQFGRGAATVTRRYALYSRPLHPAH
jgi:hypothetical protein